MHAPEIVKPPVMLNVDCNAVLFPYIDPSLGEHEYPEPRYPLAFMDVSAILPPGHQDPVLEMAPYSETPFPIHEDDVPLGTAEEPHPSDDGDDEDYVSDDDDDKENIDPNPIDEIDPITRFTSVRSVEQFDSVYGLGDDLFDAEGNYITAAAGIPDGGFDGATDPADENGSGNFTMVGMPLDDQENIRPERRHRERDSVLGSLSPPPARQVALTVDAMLGGGPGPIQGLVTLDDAGNRTVCVPLGELGNRGDRAGGRRAPSGGWTLHR